MSQTIPDNVKTRLLKLIALANDNRGNENEAASASAKVQELLAQYNLQMSQVQETTQETANPDAEREKTENVTETTQRWQVDLMSNIARNNFCLHMTEQHPYREDVRVHSLIGRKINTATTRQTYAYLMASMERLNPFVDKRTIARRSWFEGCAERLSERLWRQRQESEAESRQARQEAPRGNGVDLVLSEIYSTEEDLNRDMRWGYAPGTTAQERKDREARWATEEAIRRANPPAPEPVRHETEAQKFKREKRERIDYERMMRRWRRQDKKDAKRVDKDAFAMGGNAGNQIGLNAQIGATKQGSLF